MSSAHATQLLCRRTAGDEAAAAALMPLVYDELRALAGSFLRARRDLTLTATALVNEAYLKLIDQDAANWQSRAHFFAVAAQMIRRVLIDHIRTRQRAKRGGKGHRLSLHESAAWDGPREVLILDLHDALERLAALDERHARVVELRFFGGLTNREVASVLGVSERTVKSDWHMARAWLLKQLESGDSRDTGALQEGGGGL